MDTAGRSSDVLWSRARILAPWGHVLLATGWIGVGAALYAEAENLGTQGDFGPGAGFLIHYLALALLGLGVVLTVQTVRQALRRAVEPATDPAVAGTVAGSTEMTRRAVRFTVMALALVAFPVLDNLVGLPVAVGVLAAVTLLSHGVHLVRAVLGSAVMVGALVVIFHVLLGVPVA